MTTVPGLSQSNLILN